MNELDACRPATVIVGRRVRVVPIQQREFVLEVVPIVVPPDLSTRRIVQNL